MLDKGINKSMNNRSGSKFESSGKDIPRVSFFVLTSTINRTLFRRAFDLVEMQIFHEILFIDNVRSSSWTMIHLRSRERHYRNIGILFYLKHDCKLHRYIILFVVFNKRNNRWQATIYESLSVT